MLLVRDVYHCKPGQVKPLKEKFLAMAKLMERHKMGRMRVLTDLTGERFWTLVGEYEVADLAAFMSMDNVAPEVGKEFEAVMKGYHDFIDHGRREIFTIEG
ncbi:MAG TPA: hypothetical protein VHM30_07710 [Gemmatimonadaceae bacterium]|nr:hypothetical protein [Gemmatimonadaceae bacterium]